jgi:arylformamidase
MAASGQKVFLDYDQAELDRCYDQRAWASNADEIIRQWSERSASVQARLKRQANAAYGPTADEVLDIYPVPQAGRPILVFIHGGRWQTLSKDDSCLCADAWVNAGVNFVALNFANIPKVRLPEMVAQVRSAVAWVYRNAASFGGDPARLYIEGHSSGGHLAGCVAVTDWSKHGLPSDVVKGAICASGMYDLHPVMLSSRSQFLKLTPEEEVEFSAIRHLGFLTGQMIVTYGEKESPEFQRQSRDFAAAVEKIGRLAELVIEPGVNHFEMGLVLADPDSKINRAARKMINESA